MYPPPVQRLITELGKLPGIGQRTAQRLAFHILRSDAEDANALADAIREVKEKIGFCEICFNLAKPFMLKKRLQIVKKNVLTLLRAFYYKRRSTPKPHALL